MLGAGFDSPCFELLKIAVEQDFMTLSIFRSSLYALLDQRIADFGGKRYVSVGRQNIIYSECNEGSWCTSDPHEAPQVEFP